MESLVWQCCVSYFRLCGILQKRRKRNNSGRPCKCRIASENSRRKKKRSNTERLLTREILKTICDGTERNPEEIVVDKSGASGRTDGMVRSYDFLAHRVPELTDSKAFSYEYHPIQNLGVTDCVFVRQQAALAEAIREILGEDYSIEYKDDGRIVVMRLKPTKHF